MHVVQHVAGQFLIAYICDMKIPFGKYKGEKVSDINDLSWLRWCLQNVRMSPMLREAFIKQINSF